MNLPMQEAVKMNPDVNEQVSSIVVSQSGATATGSPSSKAVLQAGPFLIRSGSLPFKKRKLYRAGSAATSDQGQKSGEEYALKSPHDTPSKMTCFSGRDDEKIAALALVAASSSSLPVLSNTTSFPGLFLASPSQHNQRMRVIVHDETTTRGSSPESSAQSTSDSSTAAAAAAPQELSSPNPALGKLKSKVRAQHPPLMSPLPGGCHGRTSRNNSYCRRHPCYNGSKYCKLHYQMHIVKGMRGADDSANDSINSSNSGSSSSDHKSSSVSIQSPPTLPAMQTDKRFQGLQGEVKCSATTTRGRPCSYVCVNGTKFCFLHADYARNPPPRRGGGGGSSTSFKNKGRATKVCVNVVAESSADNSARSPARRGSSSSSNDNLLGGTVLLKTPNRPPSSAMATAVDGSSSLSSSSAWITPQASTISESSASSPSSSTTPRRYKKKKRILPAGKPVLSSLSYDQWLDRKVMISSGPFANHTGRVVKWGNGWVTVRVSSEEGGSKDSDGLLHNRRAIELFMVPDDGDDVPKSVRNVPGLDEPSSPLRRCVSMDATSSEAHFLRKDNVSPSDHIVVEVKRRECCEAGEMSVAEEQKASSWGRNDESKEEKAKVSSGARHDEANEQDFEVALSSPSASKPDSSEGSPPLAKSLMLAQEEGRNQGHGLLFGTAALERGRRKVHRPSRYEDTAMLEKSSGQDSEHNLFASYKHTPVSSPGSPRNQVSAPRSPRKQPEQT